MLYLAKTYALLVLENAPQQVLKLSARNSARTAKSVHELWVKDRQLRETVNYVP
jgi:hypothetical protein